MDSNLLSFAIPAAEDDGAGEVGRREDEHEGEPYTENAREHLEMRCTSVATTPTSMSTTMATNTVAVVNGVVYANRLK
jgi:hypothetical protein